MSNNGLYGASGSHSCRPYCNQTGHYNDGFSCDRRFCCGDLNIRFCCGNASLDISSSYPDKCYCPTTSCSQIGWDILLPCVAAALFVFLMITICCCQGCRRGAWCRQWLQRRCQGTGTESAGPQSPAGSVEVGHGTGIDPSFPHLPPYEFGPPKYDSLELTEAPPKYEEAMRQHEPQHQQHYDNIAFVGDVSASDGDVTPDVIRHVGVTHDQNPTLDTDNDCRTSQGQGHSSQGQDRGSASQGQDRGSASQGQDRGRMSQGQDRDRTSQGQDRDRASQGQDLGRASQGQDRDRASQGQDRDRTSQGQDRGRASEGQDRDRASQGQDRDRASQGQDRGHTSQGHVDTSCRLQSSDQESESSSVPVTTSSDKDPETPGSHPQRTSNDPDNIHPIYSIV